jgi:hypothetical protein
MALPRLLSVALAPLALVALAGCTSVGAVAVRTGPLRLPPHTGPVAIFAGGLRPQGEELGVVEVHASQEEATIDALVPLFAQKVASLGGNAAVIDGVSASFEIVSHAQVETTAYPCGYNAVCTGTRMYPSSEEVMTVSMHGRAFRMNATPRAPREGGTP